MIKLNSHKLLAAVILSIVSCLSSPIHVQSTFLKVPIIVAQNSQKSDVEPRDRARPTRRKGAGGRNPGGDISCPSLSKLGRPDLIALVPVIKDKDKDQENLSLLIPGEEIGLGITTEGYPTFWFYIPYASPDQNNRPIKVEFRMLDVTKETNAIQPMSIELSRTPGIVGIRIPDSENFLEEGKQYYWSLEIICNSQDSSSNPYVYGWIQRDRLSFEEKNLLASAKTLQQQIDFYLSKNIWYEPLALIAEYRRRHPQDESFKNYWDKLMQDELLSTIANQPVVQCFNCSSGNSLDNKVLRN